MRQLFEIDLKDYKDTDKVFRRPSARAIIFKDNRIALVYSKKEKYYKFPSGGIHNDEAIATNAVYTSEDSLEFAREDKDPKLSKYFYSKAI